MKISSATPRAAGSGMRKSSSASAIDALMSKNFRMPLPGRWEAHPDASNKNLETNLHKTFQLQMDDGRVVMARIPHPNAGPATYATASDVAVMEFTRTVLDMPVPKVLDWNASVAENPVEAEYVLTEAPSETPLGDLWSRMKPSEKKSIIEEVVELEQKLLSAELNLYGSSAVGKFEGQMRMVTVNAKLRIYLLCGQRLCGL
ncbi:Phosphotransferase enzyme [Coccidioides posadasii str. Silveira]|uniref:Phosphotransferase enzyme n=1 Tax=Coccidioides posadasii (strain RMSCC 757 / Silveira) TaxID=443226 RepID=UPI001BF10ED6|nr:Phosphotransferase enzyme [Coccidioides posadasii str. Silveira]